MIKSEYCKVCNPTTLTDRTTVGCKSFYFRFTSTLGPRNLLSLIEKLTTRFTNLYSRICYWSAAPTKTLLKPALSKALGRFYVLSCALYALGLGFY
jgi:hypothetical protein